MAKKSAREAKIERVTWFALVAIFVVYSLGDNVNYIPEYAMPIMVGAILIASGLYQYRRHYRVSPIVWLIAGAMLIAGGYALYTLNQGGTLLFSVSALALIAVFAVIAFGVFTKES